MSLRTKKPLWNSRSLRPLSFSLSPFLPFLHNLFLCQRKTHTSKRKKKAGKVKKALTFPLCCQDISIRRSPLKRFTSIGKMMQMVAPYQNKQ